MNNEAQVESVATYRLQGTRISTLFVSIPDIESLNEQLTLRYYIDASNYINFGILRTTKEYAWLVREDGIDSFDDTVVYDGSMPYLAIREHGGTIYFQASADGVLWQTLYTYNHGFTPTQLTSGKIRFYLFAGSTASPPGGSYPNIGELDDVTLWDARVAPASIAATTTLPTPTASAPSPATVTPAPIGGGAATPGYVDLPGASTDHVSTPDHNDLDITGDLELIGYFDVPDRDSTGGQQLITKGDPGNTAGAYQWRITNGGLYHLNVRDSGGTSRTYGAGAAVTEGARWRRVILDVDNGSGFSIGTFYESTDPVTTDPDSVSWTQFGTPDDNPVIAINVGTAAQVIGGRADNPNESLVGKVYVARIKSGIGGTTVADPDFRTGAQTSDGGATFVDSTGKTWTINGNADWTPPIGGGLAITLPTPTIDVSAGAATVTPAAITAITTLPIPTVLAAALIAPATVQAATSMATPAVLAAATVTPAAIEVAITFPTPVILAAVTVTPDTIQLAVSLPTPLLVVPGIRAPPAIELAATLPTPTVSALAVATPAPIAVAATLPTPTVTGAALTQPDPVTASVSLPTPIVSTSATVNPATIETAVALPTPVITVAPTVTPVAVSALVSLPVPTVDVGAAGVASPNAIAVSVTLPTPVIAIPATVSPATIQTATSLPTPVVSVPGITTPSAIQTSVSLPTPDILAASIVFPEPIAATVTLPTPTVSDTLPPPTGLTVTAISSTEINVSWDSVPTADAYDLERNSVIIVEKTTNTFFNDSGLIPNTEYTYRVRSAREV